MQTSMTIARSIPHLSASAVSDYIGCGLHYRFRRIDRIEPEFASVNLHLGTLVHKVLADYYMEKKDGLKLSELDLHSLFEQYCREQIQENEDVAFEDEADYDRFVSEGNGLLSAFHNNLPADDFKVISVEEPFQIHIKGLDLPIIGITDLVEEDSAGNIIVCDWKTSKTAYSADKIDGNFQMTVYYMAMKQNGYADREILLRLDCLIKTKTPKFEQYYTTRNQYDANRAVNRMRCAWNGIKNQVFLPSDANWRCANCEFRTHCDRLFEQEGDNLL